MVLPSACSWQEWCVSFAQWGRNAGRHTFLHDLSPRLRGNLHALIACLICAGSIPAPAGEPPGYWGWTCRSRVYPRACGGTEHVLGAYAPGDGLSPRLRGNRHQHHRHGRPDGSIPAPAGEPESGGFDVEDVRVYPRACGGTNQPTPEPACWNNAGSLSNSGQTLLWVRGGTTPPGAAIFGIGRTPRGKRRFPASFAVLG